MQTSENPPQIPTSTAAKERLKVWFFHRADQKVLAVTATIFAISFVAHLGVWFSTGGGWEGPLSWRKPVLFCLASGVTCLSLAWVLSHLQPLRFGTWQAGIFCTAILIEVGLICLQTWRGVPSHFNRSTPLDAAILSVIKATALILGLYIGIITLRATTTRFSNRAIGYSIQAGMALLLLSCGLGFLIERLGEQQAAQGSNPTIYGRAGVLKFPHGMPMHAIQMLPPVVGVLAYFGVSERQQRLGAIAAGLSLSGFTLFALDQTFRGRSRLELDAVGAIALVLSTLAMLYPLGLLIMARGKRTKGEIDR